ncbi:MAG TPA: FAD binding domain-containing protein [Bacteroidales bacterium]|nr:FAD binding domain-containing protein [Bacteroidales bacterium]OQB71498.1 MAG: 4-hydroxybenzoyl-CoA reductase subunit gamma [Bacteroidetes bacterium ADurb.Bin139]MDD3522886.1 FAD binding domain-containing protein [Bacteroidales bacterium]MDD4436281.1 FAD binding domain-containing protein [Bacteroidales bacterium]HOG24579.1 FAD binding domain-containing protein [Bacteroidales bacterium]
MDLLRFYLNGKPREIDFSQPESPPLSCSVLHYLRQYEKLTGTKEVCGAGDCGACTVVVAHADEVTGSEKRVSADSCLMRLPRLHGKHLLTIEAPQQLLDTAPIREAFLRERASQCGVCSPGMVLSSYIHLKNRLPMNQEQIRRSLSGNLCRCTGYQSIVDAMISLDSNSGIKAGREEPLDFPETENRMHVFVQGNSAYLLPLTLEDLYAARNKYPGARIASGFTGSCMDYKGPVIDISRIRELLRVHVSDSAISLGAGCSFETMKEQMGPHFPYMITYLDSFASLQVRNQASIGGNIADGSPVGDTMPLCLAHDAVCVVCGPRGTRSIKADLFTTGYRTVDLRSDEVLLAVEFPIPAEKTYHFAHKQSRRKNMDISSVSFAASVRVEGKTCKSVRLAYGGMAAVPARALHTERFLKGKVFSRANCQKASAWLEKDFSPISDVRGSAAYRMDVAKNMLILLYESYNGEHDGR